jgi:hypothetical protein
MMQEVYSCETCNEMFKRKPMLVKHRKANHPESYKYHCELCDEGMADDLRGIMIHVSKKHDAEEYFNKYLLGKEKCRFDNCNTDLTFGGRFIGSYCCQSHYESQKKIDNGIELKIECTICNSLYEDVGGLQQHLTKVHKYNKIQLKEYYDTHLKKDDEGCCKQCGKALDLVKGRFTEGYMKFCHNTSCNVLWNNTNSSRADKCSESLTIKHKTNPEISPMKKEYWIAKGYTESLAEEKVTKRQTTFSKDICIEKYGEVDGIERWKTRQRKWLDSYPKQNYSKISQELFWRIYNKIKFNYSNIYFASLNDGVADYSKNKEYRLETKVTCRLLDFYIADNHKCIEFDGEYWHGVVGRGNRTLDADRDKEIVESNPDIQIYRVKESDYKNDKDAVVAECLEFLND